MGAGVAGGCGYTRQKTKTEVWVGRDQITSPPEGKKHALDSDSQEKPLEVVIR